MAETNRGYRILARRRSGKEVYTFAVQTLLDEESYDYVRQLAKEAKLSVSTYTRKIIEEALLKQASKSSHHG
jgi:hypothetical protein